MVSNNTQLYETCLQFLESAVQRKDEERARYWSRIAFSYAPIEARLQSFADSYGLEVQDFSK